MNTTPKRIMLSSALMCSILILSVEVCTAEPQPRRSNGATPQTTFTDNVTISTGDTPTLTLNQTTAQGLPARTWNVIGNENAFFVGDSTASTTPLVIFSGASSYSLSVASNGNVGIGTSTPAGHLHVNGVGAQLSVFQSVNNDAVQFRLQTDSGNRRFVALNSAGAQQSQLVFGDNGAFDFLGPTVGVVRMKILSSGNVGIGTSDPTQLLSVNGTAGKPGGGSWATFSDERLKNIKGQFKSGLKEVMKLQPIRYEYKADNAEGIKSEGEHIGFGAQEVRKIIPEAVTTNADGYLMVDNDPILWTMLNAIKEQNAEIQDLKDQVKRLQAGAVLQAEAKAPTRKSARATANR